jgi:DNA-binding response OmpR family regulator
MARILILEDDPDIAELYRASLAEAGHDVVGVSASPGDAVARPVAPDLILLDERLGRDSGTRAIPALRRAFPGARILLATADGEAADRGRDRGADDVETKPFTLHRLLADVGALLARGR